MIPFFTYIGWISPLKDESFIANKTEPRTHEIPPIMIVSGAPIAWAKLPANKLPKGIMPKAVLHRESQKTRDKENIMSPMPKKIELMTITFNSPNTLFREAR